MTDNTLDCDFLVLGSGVAGLFAAWQASSHGRVVLVTEDCLASGSSYRAQGGIAAVMTRDDSFELHIADTLSAGRGLCDRQAVEVLVKEGAAVVRGLIASGMAFDCDARGWPSLGLEGGHSRHRVLHAQGVQTGKGMVEFFIDRVRRCPSIMVVERASVYRLLADGEGHCRGAMAYRREHADCLTVTARATLLATGGYAALFERTTNPAGSIGFGVGLARRAGAHVADLEFVQFHPTAFHDTTGRSFLISEALRGAGATLVNEAGQRFLANVHGAELAPRDVVAAAIAGEMAGQRQPFVGLDLRHLDPAMLQRDFGFIMDSIAEQGIDPAQTPVPVAPAAHYCIGGVSTDHEGATDVPGLYAIGEVAATGVHGANRLASNSLLECLVFAQRAVRRAAAQPVLRAVPISPQPALSCAPSRATEAAVRRRRLAALLTHHVGIERNRAGLEHAQAVIDEALAQAPWDDAMHEYHALRDRHVHELAAAITHMALARKHSAGVHRRSDDCVRAGTCSAA